MTAISALVRSDHFGIHSCRISTRRALPGETEDREPHRCSPIKHHRYGVMVRLAKSPDQEIARLFPWQFTEMENVFR
jgi:hypothetical protein